MRAFSFITVAAAAALSFVPSVFAAPLEAGAAAGAVAAVNARAPLDAVAAAGAIAGLDTRGSAGCNDILADVKVSLAVQVDILSKSLLA